MGVSGIMRGRIKRFCTTLFLSYLLSVIYLTLFTFNHYVYGKSVNLIFFDSIKLMLASKDLLLIIKNILGNLILFFPLGFFLPILRKRFRKFWTILGIGFFSSLLIEACQYEFAQRIFDVDDILLNTIGAIVGWIFYKFLNSIKEKIVIW